jgi:hypothetical protein
MLRSILTMASILTFPAAAAAHSSLVPHAHPHGPSLILSTEAALLALACSGLAVLVLRHIANRQRAPKRIRRGR